MNQPECRSAVETDNAAVRALLVDAALWLEARGVRQWRADDFTPAWVAARIAAGEVWLATVDRAPAGTLRLLDADPMVWPDADEGDALYLHSLAVDRAFSGTGPALLAFAEDQARRRGRRCLRLDCWAGNERLIRYYSDAGFAPCGVRREADWEVQRFEKPV